MSQVGDISVAEHHVHVWRRIHERRAQVPGLDERGPELAREPELPSDLFGPGRIGGIGHVIELAQACVAGAGVVPCRAALGGQGVEALENEHRPVGLESGEERTQRRRHYPAADQHGVVIDIRCATGGSNVVHDRPPHSFCG